MSNSSLLAWLAAQAAQREERGLTRRLTESDRGEPLLVNITQRNHPELARMFSVGFDMCAGDPAARNGDRPESALRARRRAAS